MKHQHVMLRMGHVLYAFVAANNLGFVAPDIYVALPTGNGVAPDVTFLSNDKLSLYNEAIGSIDGSPDLVVEIHSPSTAEYDRVKKKVIYHAAEVPWVWFVAQESYEIEELQWIEEGCRLVSSATSGETFKPTLFPGLEINLAALMGNG